MNKIPSWKKRLMRRRFLISTTIAAAVVVILAIFPIGVVANSIKEAPIIGAVIVQIVALCVAIQSMNKTRNTSVVAKTVDVSMHCTLRYDKLQDMRTKIDSKKRSLIKAKPEDVACEELEIEYLEKDYESSFWVLKSDQFDFWLIGALDHDTFFDWSYYLSVKYLRELNPPCTESELGKSWSIRTSWERWRGAGGGLSHGGSNPRFVGFINKLMKTVDEYHSKNCSQEKLLARAILDIMKDMEGSDWYPGFSKMYRGLAWSGFKFGKYYQLMYDDLDDENGAAEIANSSESRLQ